MNTKIARNEAKFDELIGLGYAEDVAIAISSVGGGFREKTYDKSVEIIERHRYENGDLTNDDLAILRDCWECSRSGNLLCDAVQNSGLDLEDFIQQIVCRPGFLNAHELWHTRRVRHHKVLAYRGCSGSEVEAAAKGEAFLGASWSLSEDIARFFADGFAGKGGNVVVSAYINVDAWLDTSEHELVSVWVRYGDIIDVAQHIQENIGIDWEQRPRIRPYMQTQKKVLQAQQNRSRNDK